MSVFLKIGVAITDDIHRQGIGSGFSALPHEAVEKIPFDVKAVL
jgi:hypothetical protein